MTSVLEPQDLLKLKSLGEARISPDGSQVAYTVATPDKKTDKNSTCIWMFAARNPVPRRFTQSGKDKASCWSPDGTKLAFVSERSGKPQIWIMDVEGGEAWHLPTAEAVRGIAWSPDGKSIAFVSKAFTKSDDWRPYPGAPKKDRQRAVAQAKHLLEGSKPAAKTSDDPPGISQVKVITRFKYRADGQGYLGDLRNHVFVVDVPETPPESDKALVTKRLTDGDFDHDSPVWSKDGRYIAFTALRREDADYLQKQDIWLVCVKTGRLVQLYAGDGPVLQPRFSPSGRKIAFVGHDNSFGGSTISKLWAIDVEAFLKTLNEDADAAIEPLSQNKAVCLTKQIDRPVGSGSASDVRYGMSPPFRWENDEAILCILADGGAGTLHRIEIEPGQADTHISKIWHGEMRNLVAFDYRAGTFVLQIGSPYKTEELHLFDEHKGGITQITDLNPWLGEVTLGKTEHFAFKGAQGWDIEGFLTYPPHYEAGKRYPMVLSIHGGPAGAYGPNFTYQWQALAAKGFVVLGINPRGSTSYSQQFTSAVVGDWGGQDYLDLMAGVDEAVARGIADPAKLFVTGWSYGGYMTSWVVTQTDRFKAAVGGAIISNRHSMYSTEDIVLTGEHHFDGNPWDDADKLLSRSALSFVKNVTTPFMILHGELDVRCPTSQGEEFYTALKRLDKNAVFVRYPGEYHGFNRLSHKIDRVERIIAWYEYHADKA